MPTTLTLIGYAFDLFILLIYLERILKLRRDSISVPLFYGSFLLVEIILYINAEFIMSIYSDSSFLITTILSFATTLGLSFLYKTTMRHRLFTSLMFQIFALMGENLFSTIIGIFNGELFTADMELLFPVMNLGSKMMLFLLVLASAFFWNKKFDKVSPVYHLMLFVTPALTLFIMISIPSAKIVGINESNFFLTLFGMLILLNILNYFMLSYFMQLTELKLRNTQLQQQITFQTEKYQQLSLAYRKSRRIVHDTKKHYFSIQTYIKNQALDKLEEYLVTAIEDLENTYAKINTGNLVIDAFVTNYMDAAAMQGIAFTTDIHIDPQRVPMEDYDLCVVFGNLLDNSIQACQKLPPSQNRYIHVQIYISPNDTFIIHMSNPLVPSAYSDAKSSDELLHGYGLENVQNIVERYHGMFSIVTEKTYDTYVVLPIMHK